jgi:hypothetical protein
MAFVAGFHGLLGMTRAQSRGENGFALPPPPRSGGGGKKRRLNPFTMTSEGARKQGGACKYGRAATSRLAKRPLD